MDIMEEIVTCICNDEAYHGKASALTRASKDYSSRGIANGWLEIVNGFIDRNAQFYGDRDGAKKVTGRERLQIAVELMDAFAEIVSEIDAEEAKQ